MRSLLYASLIVCLAAPACAQSLNILGADSLRQKTQEQADQETQRNKDYQEKLKELPDQNVKKDPWGNIRGSGSAQSDPSHKQKQASEKAKKAGAQ